MSNFDQPEDWTTYNWAFEMDLRIFLLVGACGVLRKHLPFALPAACVAYWAYIVGIGATEGPCGFENSEELELHIIWVTNFSFWMHWFPTSLLLLNLDTCLRSEWAIYLMGRLKQKFGRWLILFMAIMLVISYCVGTVPIFRQDWQRLGFSHCPMLAGWLRNGNSPSIPYVLAGLPFYITAFSSLHLASAPALDGQKDQKDDHDHLLPFQVPLAFLCEAFRHLGRKKNPHVGASQPELVGCDVDVFFFWIVVLLKVALRLQVFFFEDQGKTRQMNWGPRDTAKHPRSAYFRIPAQG